jgi:ABC-2 type transport system ATP-binding protein
MDHGRLLALDTPQALIRSLAGESTLEVATDLPLEPPAVEALAALQGVERVEHIGPNGARLSVSGDAVLLVAPAAAALGAHGLALTDVKLGAPTLEDVFIQLTGRTLR